MTFADLVIVGISFVIGYVLGTVYPAWQPEQEESEEQEEN